MAYHNKTLPEQQPSVAGDNADGEVPDRVPRRCHHQCPYLTAPACHLCRSKVVKLPICDDCTDTGKLWECVIPYTPHTIICCQTVHTTEQAANAHIARLIAHPDSLVNRDGRWIAVPFRRGRDPIMTLPE